MKIMKEGKIRVHSLIHNILGVRGACWGSEMGTKTSDRWVNYSYGFVQTKEQVG
jgi:hypothetical protein